MTNEELDIKAREHARDYSGAMWATARESYIAGFRDAEEQNRWIPVTERLPELRTYAYQILTKNDSVNIMFIASQHDIDLFKDKNLGHTHWKEII